MLFLNVIFIIAENSVEPIFYTLLNLFPMFDLFYSFKYFSFILNIKVMINIFVTSFDGLEFWVMYKKPCIRFGITLSNNGIIFSLDIYF